MQLYESRLSYFNDKARINYCKSPSVHQHGGRSRPRQNCHSCIFETNENSNLRICIQYLGHHSKTTCQKSAKSMGYRVRPKFEFYRKSLLILLNSIILKPNLIVSGIQWLIKCPFCRELHFHPFAGMFKLKSCLTPHITLMINKTGNFSVNERCSDEGCQKSPSAVILAFFTGTSTHISTIELV